MIAGHEKQQRHCKCVFASILRDSKHDGEAESPCAAGDPFITRRASRSDAGAMQANDKRTGEHAHDAEADATVAVADNTFMPAAWATASGAPVDITATKLTSTPPKNVRIA